MDSAKKREIEARLKNLFDTPPVVGDKVVKVNKPKVAMGNVIRRRKGEVDKRMTIEIK